MTISGYLLPFLLHTTLWSSEALSDKQANEHTNHLRSGVDEERRTLRELELTDKIRIRAKVHGKRGEHLVKSCARQIIQDKDSDGFMTFEGRGDCMTQFKDDPDVDADFDFPVSALGSGFDSSRSLQEIVPWGLTMIHADQLEAGEHEIIICLVDTGIALGHPDFDSDRITGDDANRFMSEPWSWNIDKSGHGTHVAGTLAALAGNGIGVRGAGQFHLHVTRGIGDDGFGYEYDLRNAIDQCVQAGANIINLSLGSRWMSATTNNLLTEVVEELGIMVVAAAGNDGRRLDSFPASHPSVISVAAVYEWGTRWGRSNYGDQVELSAPGSQILSTSVSTSEVQVATEETPLNGFYINGANQGTVTGKLVFCENGEKKCKKAKHSICLMVLEDESLEDMLKTCEESRGIGAIIFNAESSSHSDWVAQSNIPAMSVDRETAIDLVQHRLGEEVTIGAVAVGEAADGLSYTYEELSGTSMAAPHVVAAAALVWSHFGNRCSNHQIRYALAVSAQDPSDASGCNENYGYGIVDATAANEWLQANDCLTWAVPQVSQGGCTTV